jgi:hypothetical protein
MVWITMTFLAQARDEYFFLHHCSQTGSGAPPASLSNRYEDLFSQGKNGCGMKLTTHHHLVPSLKMGSALPPLKQTIS